jgi:exonuclease III
MRFGTWNVRGLYRVGSLVLVSQELSKYKLDLVGVQEVRWEGGGTEPTGECTYFNGKENENQNWVQGFCAYQHEQLREPSLLVMHCHT